MENIKKTLNEHYKEKQRKKEEEEALLLQHQQQLLQQQQLQLQQAQLQHTLHAHTHVDSNPNDNPSFNNLLKEQQLLEKQQRVEYDKISPSVPSEKNTSDVQYLLPEYKFSSSAPTLPPTPKPLVDSIPPATAVSPTSTTDSISIHNELIEPSAPPSSDVSSIPSNSISSQQIVLSPPQPQQVQPSLPPSQPQQPYATYQPMQYATIPNTQQRYGMGATFPQPQQASMYQQPLFIPQPQMGFPISMLPMMPQQMQSMFM